MSDARAPKRKHAKLEEYSKNLEELARERTAELVWAAEQLRLEIAEREKIEQELRQAREELEQRVNRRTAELLETNESLRREIVERKRADKALRNSETRLRIIADAVPDIMFILDPEGRFVEVLNHQQCLLLSGLHLPGGKLLSEVFSASLAERFLEVVRQTLLTGQTQVVEYDIQGEAFGQRWFEARTAPMKIPGAASPMVVVVARDITNRKAAEEQLFQAQKMDALGQLTRGIAHDFNNLLAIILGNLELLEEQVSGRSESGDLVRRAVEAAERGALLTQRLLAFSRQQPLQTRPTNLNQLVTGMIDLLRRTLGETIQVQTILAGDLWPAVVNPAQFENGLINLAVNARDAMPRGGKLVVETDNVELNTDDAANHRDALPGEYVMLAVTDNGVGMTPDVLERACEPFFTTKETGRGSGLGLNMVYGLVRQSGGHMVIQSDPGQGAMVKVYLPRAQAPGATEEQPDEAMATVHPGKAETILVVEDDAQVRQLAVSMLSRLGYTTVEAGSARIALQSLAERPQIALLFTDIVLPGGMNGVELAEEAQRQYPDLKVLFTSGYPENALAHHQRPNQNLELIPKPYRKVDLAHKLHAILA